MTFPHFHSTPRPSALTCLAALFILLPASHMLADHGRRPSPADNDPCGLPDTTSREYRLAAALNWGYGYDSLKADLSRWSASPFVSVDSVGATVQNRAIFMMTIQDTTVPAVPRKRVWIHARTHPNEVQGTWVTNQIIAELIGPTSFAQQMRNGCVFNIIPMINPDGVELKRSRQNANNIDIESNWTAVPGEPEVQTLRRMFVTLMSEPNPIRIALNMHSGIGTSRYFVYHAAGGTSAAYAEIQQRFINAVRSHFPGGIQPYNYFVSWTSAPALQYPESWFWQNHREGVLALTYEDMNDPSARAFDSTAHALLYGISDEVGITGSTQVLATGTVPLESMLEQNFPNPFNPTTRIRYTIARVVAPSGSEGPATRVRLAVYDLLGREVAVLMDEYKMPGTYRIEFDGAKLASGVYVCRMTAGSFAESIKMVLMK